MSTFTVPPHNRLRKKYEFDHVFQTGHRLNSQYFIFIVAPSKSPQARLGVVVSKRKCRFAVDRNRVKRVVREHFRHLKHQLPGVDLVVLLKSPIENSRDLAITKCLEKQFMRLVERCDNSVSN